ncbi:DUF5765 domain-containing protein [Methylomonas sp. AM2-LC]|uniref:DUF5765 domain-containing protein n=1 Tax=Methylomonas sp. AM2-LC TaxID=3153301 RepID=UPI00326569F6
MCFSANMSLSLGLVGLAASSVTYLDKTEPFWVRVARAYAIFHFSLMEFIQFFAYPVADQCGYGTNMLLSELSTYHISLQAFAIMPALATYSSDVTSLKKATLIGATLSGLFLLCSFLPNEWQLFDIEPNFIGKMVSCLYMGIYHIGYSISSAFGLFVTHGSLFALAISGFLWKNNWKIASYHFVMAIMTLFVPQWFFKVSTGEAAAMYCFYSIPITASFMPYFKTFCNYSA